MNEQEDDSWFDKRDRGITACDAAVACGIGKYAKPKALWEVKTGRVARNTKGNSATNYGKMMEPKILKFYQWHTTNVVEEGTLHWHTVFTLFIASSNISENPQLYFLGATPDAIVQQDKETGKQIIVEVKSPMYAEFDYIPVEYMRTQQVRIWRVYRSKMYFRWMETRLQHLWNCILTDNEPSDDIIPCIYHEVTDLVKSGYNFSVIRTKLPRKMFPPPVYSELRLTTQWNPSQQLQSTYTSNLRLKFGVFGTALLLCLLMLYWYYA